MASPSKSRLQAMCRRLALGRLGTANRTHVCCFCDQPILPGDSYRNAGVGAKAHDVCFHAVNREVNR